MPAELSPSVLGGHALAAVVPAKPGWLSAAAMPADNGVTALKCLRLLAADSALVLRTAALAQFASSPTMELCSAGPVLVARVGGLGRVNLRSLGRLTPHFRDTSPCVGLQWLLCRWR